jgi:hypothetical protein
MIRGNLLGLGMIVAVSPIALIGGFVLKLGDPITMSCVGLGLTGLDFGYRFRARPATGWLMDKQFGGYLYFIPVWIFGLFVIGLNVAQALSLINLN